MINTATKVRADSCTEPLLIICIGNINITFYESIDNPRNSTLLLPCTAFLFSLSDNGILKVRTQRHELSSYRTASSYCVRIVIQESPVALKLINIAQLHKFSPALLNSYILQSFKDAVWNLRTSILKSFTFPLSCESLDILR